MRSKPLILAFTAIVLLTIATLQTLDLRWRRELVRRTAEARVASQTAVVAEYVRNALVAADSSLRQLAYYSQRIGGPNASTEEWLPILEAAKAALAEQGSLSVTDAEGVVRHSTLPSIVGQSRREHYLYESLAGQETDRLVLDVPFMSPVFPGRFVLPVGRRLQTVDGRFDGLVVQVITPEAFRPFFRSVRIGAEGAIWVFHPSGTIVFREPSTGNPLGEDGTGNPIFQAARRTAGSGVIVGPFVSGGARYISGYRSLDGPELIVAVSLSEYEILADWRAQRRRAVVELTALTGVMAVLLLFVVRQIRARSTVERALAEVQQTEAERLRHANDRLEAALRRETQAHEETEAASRLKDEFLMTLSHELRTPMNAILGWAHMLANGTVAGGQERRALATIERNAAAQARLIEDLLDVSRAITGKLQVTTRSVDVADSVEAAIDTLRPALQAKNLAFDLDVDRRPCRVQADPDRLQQIIWNLVSNAIKFTPPGGRVQMRVGPVTGGIEIVVRDTGAGIQPSFLPHVFERFRQADAGLRREQSGLGLGLAIARHLVELHGGTIAAESPGEGHGATFRVVLPAEPPDHG